MNIPGNFLSVQQEATQFRGSISEFLMQQIGANINGFLSAAELAHVGDIKVAFLSEAQFQAQLGDAWILMDGRDVSGSSYATLTGSTTVPDARGVFLKNKQNGRVDQADELPLGSYQSDSIVNHAHLASVTINNGINVFSSGSPNLNAGSAKTTPTTSATITATIGSWPGDAENTPTNITCNFFIKIN